MAFFKAVRIGMKTVRQRLAHAMWTRISNLPYQLGLSSLWPGSSLARVPDRYCDNASKATQRSGVSLFRDAAGFLHKNTTNRSDLTRFYLFNLVFEQMIKEGVQGDIAELGVYRGNTAALLAAFARSTNRVTYLFDTFAGFSAEDTQGIDANKRLEFGDTSLASVQRLVGLDRVKYVVGHFPQSAAALTENLSFSLVHLDCDLYAPMKAGLEYFFPRLAPGGFLLAHDYGSLHWDGAERAVDEFFADRRERVVPIPDRGGTVVIRKI